MRRESRPDPTDHLLGAAMSPPFWCPGRSLLTGLCSGCTIVVMSQPVPSPSNIPYIMPDRTLSAFNCPHCHVFAKQGWGDVQRYVGNTSRGSIEGLQMCSCEYCDKYSIWFKNKMVFPLVSTAPAPSGDMPDDARDDYEEARQVVMSSPRGAAALLRLAVQKLCKQLGEAGKNVNGDIASLVKKGLPVQVQQSLDIVRVVGNNAVHPGQIDLKDDTKTAGQLFELLNIIVDVMITQPAHVESLFENIVPESQREAIVQRDGK